MCTYFAFEIGLWASSAFSSLCSVWKETTGSSLAKAVFVPLFSFEGDCSLECSVVSGLKSFLLIRFPSSPDSLKSSKADLKAIGYCPSTLSARVGSEVKPN